MLAACPLQHVGEAVDDCLKQGDQDGFAVGAADVGFLGAHAGMSGRRAVHGSAR